MIGRRRRYASRMFWDEGPRMAVTAVGVLVATGVLAGVLVAVIRARYRHGGDSAPALAHESRPFLTRYLAGWFDDAESELRLTSQLVTEGLGSPRVLRRADSYQRKISATARWWADRSIRRGEVWALLRVVGSMFRRTIGLAFLCVVAVAVAACCLVLVAFVVVVVPAFRPRATAAWTRTIADRRRQGEPALAFNASWDDALQPG